MYRADRGRTGKLSLAQFRKTGFIEDLATAASRDVTNVRVPPFRVLS